MLSAYLPVTYTWIYNQLRFFSTTDVLVLSSRIDHSGLDVRSKRITVYSFPGLPPLRRDTSPVSRMAYRAILLATVRSRLNLYLFARKASAFGCALIHAHFADVACDAMPIAGKLGVPLVVSFYGYDYDYLPRHSARWRKRYEALYARGSLFLVEGDHGRRKLLERGVAPERVEVHHLGVDVEKVPLEERILRDGEPLRLIQVASFVEKKGHAVLVEAMRLLRDDGMGDRVRLKLVGDGPLKAPIAEKIKGYGLEGQIKIAGVIPYSELHKELLRHHVFVHPSLTAQDGDCEGGAPVVLLDAQATGMPVLATFHCDIPEEVLDGETGILVEEGHSEALARAIRRFAEEPRLLNDYGVAARQHIDKHYSAPIQARKLESIFRTLIQP
jgi:colanic acid/amylovoran biosynthesis glycosyltransferase